MLQDGKQQQEVELPGHAQYHEAANILGALKAPKRRLARYYKPSSLFGSVGYYAKQIFQFLFMNGPRRETSASESMSRPLSRAVDLLQESAVQGNEDAIFTLAEMNFFGVHLRSRNYTEAFRRYADLTASEGNATAQHMLGFMYATGIGGVVERDQARALLYHTFAADAGEVRSQMTVAYRHHTGIGTPRNCEQSVVYYKQVAEAAMAWKHSGPPGGQSLSTEGHRFADEDGGIYGEGASVSSSGPNAKQSGPTHDVNAAFDDVLEYLDLMSRKGELRAIFNLGRLHYDGSRALEQNYRIAADKFFDVARRYWDKNGKIRPDIEHGVDKLASRAAGFLGRMFLRGEGLEQNYAIAKVWFKRGIQNGDPLAQYSLGIMHLDGLGMPKDPVKAAEYFGAAADENFAVAQVRLGALLLDQGDLAPAVKYFELAARQEHIEAFYYLAEIANQGIGGGARNCNQAALYYKKVAEKAEPLHSNFGEANDAYEEGDYETAMLLNMMSAEQGYEVAQANVAFLLDRFVVHPASQLSRFFSSLTSTITSFDFRLPFLSSATIKAPSGLFGDAALAVVYWTRSARGGNIDSLLKLGDYYLAELGVVHSAVPEFVDESPIKNNKTRINENHAKAAACYSAASETLQSAQALFNLGWMHENGIGLEQDFHLAKRYYDAATEPPMKEAKAPVALALIKLRVRGWWDWVTGGSINQIGDSESEEKEKQKKKKTFKEWFSEFVAADLEQYEEEDAARREAGDDGNYMNEWGESLHGGYDGEDWEDYGDGLVETLVIVGLAASLAFLVWYRQMVNLRERARLQREQQQQAIAQQPEGPASPFTSTQVPPQAQAQQQPSQAPLQQSATSSTSPSSISASTSQPPIPARNPDPASTDADSHSSSRAQSNEGDSNGWSFVDLPPSEAPPGAGNREPGAPGGPWAPGPGGIGH